MTKEMFAIGEIAVYIGPSTSGLTQYLIGSEVTVSRELRVWSLQEGGEEYGYVVTHPTWDSCGFVAPPECLRKIRPPREDLKVVRWDQCPWQPETINV